MRIDDTMSGGRVGARWALAVSCSRRAPFVSSMRATMARLREITDPYAPGA